MQSTIARTKYACPLSNAFAKLRQSNLFARRNFQCCNTCGCAEMGALQKSAIGQGKPRLGYVFYHNQNERDLRAGRGLHLSYGSFDEQKMSLAAIAELIVSALRSFGIDCEWNGDVATKIYISEANDFIAVNKNSSRRY